MFLFLVLSELIKCGKNGLLVPAFDVKGLSEAIISLLDNEILNKNLGKEARRTVEERFSSTKFASETYGIYSQTLSRN